MTTTFPSVIITRHRNKKMKFLSHPCSRTHDFLAHQSKSPSLLPKPCQFKPYSIRMAVILQEKKPCSRQADLLPPCPTYAFLSENSYTVGPCSLNSFLSLPLYNFSQLPHLSKPNPSHTLSLVCLPRYQVRSGILVFLQY